MRSRILLFACALVLQVTRAGAFTFDPKVNFDDVGRSYFAPTALGYWRLIAPDGGLINFQVVKVLGDGRYEIAAENKWVGRVDGEKAVLRPLSAKGHGVSEYRFVNGELRALVQNGEVITFDYPEILPSSFLPPALWQVQFRESELRKDMFAGCGRMRLGFKNPNCFGALMAELAVLAFGLLLVPRTVWRVHGCLQLGILLLLMGQSRSRGALLAFGLVSIVVLFARGRAILRSISLKRMFSMALIGLAVISILFLGYRNRFMQREVNWQSDRGRTETLASVPAMIACAPGGWNDPFAGMTYVKWFQDLDRAYLVKDMMNEHLTFLVMHSWPVRFAYLFGWLGVLAFLIGFIRKGGSPIPLGVWIVQGVTAALNRTYASPTLWIVPAGALIYAAWRTDWRVNWRFYLHHAAVAAGAAIAFLVVVQVLGSRMAGRNLPCVRSDGVRVCINGNMPLHWIVNEPSVFNPTYVGKEIRRFYRMNPSAPALGCVRKFADLPPNVEHLTLFGKSCELFVELYRKNGFLRLPKRLTFMSPTLPPESIPIDLVQRCRLHVYVGTFLARYWATDMEWRPPDWVTLVPGAEIYIPGWMRFCVN